MKNINGKNRFGEELVGIASEVVIAIHNDLNELVAVTGEAAFVCFPSCDGKRMAFRGVGPALSR